jgi:hypothetical protein
MKTNRRQLSLSRNKYAFGMKAIIFAFAALILSVGRSAPAVAITIDFENLPSLPAKANNFAAAGVMQIYTVPGVFTISGGVVLGNPTFLATFPLHGTPPNLYGTTDVADPSLLSTITLTLPSAEDIVSVSGVLFNGQPITEDYVVNAFSGATLVATNAFASMAPDFSTSGFGNFSLTSGAAQPITSVTITTPDVALNGWDFFVDTITISAAVSPIPEPSTALLFLASALGVLMVRRRRNKSAQKRQRSSAPRGLVR